MLLTEEEIKDAVVAIQEKLLQKLTESLPDVREEVIDALLIYKWNEGIEKFRNQRVDGLIHEAEITQNTIHALYAAAFIAANEEGKREERERIKELAGHVEGMYSFREFYESLGGTDEADHD